MKKFAVLLAPLFLLPSISFAAPLTQSQAESLINIVQSSRGTPASAFVSLITAFSNITTTQAADLIAVVQSSPSVLASAFINLLTSFMADVATTQDNPVTNTTSYPNSCNGVGSPSCPTNYTFVCPSSGAGYCAPGPASFQTTLSSFQQSSIQSDEQQIQQEQAIVDGLQQQVIACNAKDAAIANEINSPYGPGQTLGNLQEAISMARTQNAANCSALEVQLGTEALKLKGLSDSLSVLTRYQ